MNNFFPFFFLHFLCTDHENWDKDCLTFIINCLIAWSTLPLFITNENQPVDFLTVTGNHFKCDFGLGEC